MKVKEMIQDKLLLRRLVIVLTWTLISAAYAPFFNKVRGTYLEYILLTSVSILFASSGIIQDYLRNLLSSIVTRNIIIVCDVMNMILIYLIYKEFQYITINELPLVDENTKTITTYIIVEVIVVSVQTVMTGILGSRMKGYLGKIYGNRYESIDFKEKKLTSIISILGLVVFGLLYKVLGAGITLCLGAGLNILSNVYDVMNTKALIELDRIRNDKNR